MVNISGKFVVDIVPALSSLDWGDRVMRLNHPPHPPPQTLNWLKTKELRINHKTKIDSQEEETPKQLSDPTPTSK